MLPEGEALAGEGEGDRGDRGVARDRVLLAEDGGSAHQLGEGRHLLGGSGEGTGARVDDGLGGGGGGLAGVGDAVKGDLPVRLGGERDLRERALQKEETVEEAVGETVEERVEERVEEAVEETVEET